MKFLKKPLAVAMSAALCVSLVSPAFAADFRDLQTAIDDIGNGAGQQIGDSNRYGYGEKKEDGTYGIEAWTEDDGSRSVKLNEDVTYSPDPDPDNTDEPHSVTVNAGESVTLDLDGHDINGTSSDGDSNDAPIIVVSKGYPEAELAPGELTVTGSGKITGGEGGVRVGAGASLTVEGGADISGNESYDIWLDYEPTNTSAPEEGGTGATVTGGSWKDTDGNSYSETVDSSDAGYALSLKKATPVAPTGGNEPAAPAEVEIGDTDVPLAGDTMTGAEFVNYIWRHEGQPESDQPAANALDHEYAPAIAWAQSIGLIDDGFQLDELLTVADARIILTRLAAWKGIEMPELAALTGKDSDPVLNCTEVLKEFFGED